MQLFYFIFALCIALYIQQLLLLYIYFSIYLYFANHLLFFLMISFCYFCTQNVGSSSTTVKHHSFISQVPDVRNMEKALLGLLEDFHSGKLRAFSGSCTMEQMTNIREQQEKLAKMHFDLTSQNDPSLTDESLKQSQNSMSQLIERLEQLSMSIEALHSDVEK